MEKFCLPLRKKRVLFFFIISCIVFTTATYRLFLIGNSYFFEHKPVPPLRTLLALFVMLIMISEIAYYVRFLYKNYYACLNEQGIVFANNSLIPWTLIQSIERIDPAGRDRYGKIVLKIKESSSSSLKRFIGKLTQKNQLLLYYIDMPGDQVYEKITYFWNKFRAQ